MELWALTGFDRAQSPPSSLFRAARWEHAEVCAHEGRPMELPMRDPWYLDPPAPRDDVVGVDPFA